jgi:tetratricopeptide (TPR) repeat protein
MTTLDLTQFPYPLAVHVRRLLGEGEPGRRFSLFFDAFSSYLKYVSLTFLADYLQGELVASNLNERLLALRKPSLGHWHDFLQCAVSTYEKADITPFIKELPEHYRRVELKRRLRKDECPDHPDVAGMGLVSCLIYLRNSVFAHNVSILEAAAERFLSCYEPRLLEIIGDLRFLARYPLFLVRRETGAWADGPTLALRLMGPSMAQLVEEERDFPGQEAGTVLVTGPGHDRTLRLHPLTVYEVLRREVLALDGIQDLLLYDGYTRRGVLYTGAVNLGSRIEREEPLRAYLDKVEAKATPAPGSATSSPWAALSATCASLTDATLRDLRASGKFIDEAFFRRAEIGGHLERFLASDARAFLLKGASGIGKTTVVCNLALGQLREGASVLLLEGARLPATELEGYLATLLRLDQPLQSSLAASADTAQRQLLIIFDAINENPRFHELLEQVGRLVLQLQQLPWVKIIMAMREVMLEVYRSQRAAFLPEHLFYRVPLPDGSWSTEVPLERMSPDEVEGMYEAYASVHRFAPRTPFALLPSGLKQVISHPWLLRMLVEAYHGKDVPADATQHDILHQFLQHKLAGRHALPKRRFLSRISTRMFESATDQISLDSAIDDEELRREIENFERDSAYVQLLDDGILRETSREMGRLQFEDFVRYTFDRMFDAAMCSLFLERTPSLDAPAVLAYLRRTGEHPALLGSAELVLEALLDRNPTALSTLLCAPEGAESLLQEPLLRLSLRRVETRPADVRALLDGERLPPGARIRFAILIAELYRRGFSTSSYDVFHALTECLTSRLEGTEPPLAHVFFWEGQMCQEQSLFPDARRLMGRCLALTEDPVTRADAMTVIGMTHRYEQDMARARETFDSVSSLLANLEENATTAPMTARYLYEEGYWHRLSGNYPEALRAMGRSLELCRNYEYPLQEAASACFRGVVLFDLGRLADATSDFRRSLEIAERIQSPLWIANARFHDAEVAVVEQDWARAERGFATRLDFFRKIRDPIGIYWTTAYQAWARFLRTGFSEGVVNAFAEAFEEFEKIRYWEGSLTFSNRSVWMYMQLGDLEAAGRSLDRSRALLGKTTFAREELLFRVLCAWHSRRATGVADPADAKAVADLRGRTGSVLFDHLVARAGLTNA